MHQVSTYILAYNQPNLLDRLLTSLKKVDETFLTETNLIIVDQSDQPSTDSGYAEITKKFGAKRYVTENAGTTGGRLKCSEHFHSSNADLMYYLEDDQVFRGPHKLNRACQEILKYENLAALKLAAQSGDPTRKNGYGSHGWRLTNFASGAVSTATVGWYDDLPYAIGDISYSNYPMLMPKWSNEKLFIEPKHPKVSEGYFVGLFEEKRRSQQLRYGTLLASVSRQIQTRKHVKTKLGGVDPEQHVTHVLRPT